MNLITVTYNADTHQLVPREPSITMQKMAEDLYGSITYRGGYRLRDVYQTMLAAAPQAESAWLDISSAPRDGSLFLAYEKGYGVKTCFWWRGQDSGVGGFRSPLYPHGWRPTHWMPLPQEPKPEQGK